MTQESRLPEGPIGSELVREDASFAGLVVQFLDGLGERLTTMEDAFRASDFERLRMAAHKLKGSGGGYGYPILSERAGELERCANGRALEDCACALDDLKRVAARVVVGPDP